MQQIHDSYDCAFVVPKKHPVCEIMNAYKIYPRAEYICRVARMQI